MSPLQAVVSFWRDCIKSESALEQNFGVSKGSFTLPTNTRAALFTGESDPFIFAESNFTYTIHADDPAYKLLRRAILKDREIHFGYPILMFFDEHDKANHIAPLFVMGLDAELTEDGILLSRGELSPTLGSNAFSKLGLHQEEIAALNSKMEEVFENNRTNKLETILYLLKKETRLIFVEGIDPTHLSHDSAIHPYSGTVVYNKAIVYESEASTFNFHLLNDLEALTTKDDLQATGLRYLIHPPTDMYSEVTPVLPFDFDECQLRAIQHIVGSDHTVVTGPPGTGKSQFIANLIINLFLEKKRVLFVSHTSEAVRVVNERVNGQFANLITLTGKKAVRQELGRRLEAMVAEYNGQSINAVSTVTMADITDNWNAILQKSAYLKKTDVLDNKLLHITRVRKLLENSHDLFATIRAFITKLAGMRISRKLQGRETNHKILSDIELLKSNHVALSRTYVKDTYLSLIFENGHYGALQAYIDSVQNRKFGVGRQQDNSDKYIHAALKAMNIWSCTLKSLSATFPLTAGLFDYVIFDEASQIDMPSAAPALYRAQRIVVVGDEKQLTHIAKINTKVEESIAERYHLASYPLYPALSRYSTVSLFKSARHVLAEPEQELTNHYRSHALIATLFSSVLYDGKLKIYEPDNTLPASLTAGVFWADVKGVTQKHKNGSRFNETEAVAITTLMKRLLPIANKEHLTIGIATPYTRQRDLILDKLLHNFSDEELSSVRVMTVHKFQGSEVDILIFSTVLAQKGDGNSDYWYAANPQLLNVAISRAKQMLVIAGDLGFARGSISRLKDIATCYEQMREGVVRDIPKRPMNIFEKQLLDLLEKIAPASYKLEPQYVVGGRFSIDIAVLGKQQKFAVELDGSQHEIVGGLPVFADKARDKYLQKDDWKIIRITVDELINQREAARERLKGIFS